jgi:hypothetical protein
MRGGSVAEYAEAVRVRHERARGAEKKQTLDELTRVTGYHKKAAIQLLRRRHGRSPGAWPGPSAAVRPRGRRSPQGGLGGCGQSLLASGSNLSCLNWPRSSRTALDQLVRLYVNLIQPVMKLQHKTRSGAKVHKVYDTARTSYRRLLETNLLTTQQRDALARQYQRLNPVRLRIQIHQTSEWLWSLAELPNQHDGTVTPPYEATYTLGRHSLLTPHGLRSAVRGGFRPPQTVLDYRVRPGSTRTRQSNPWLQMDAARSCSYPKKRALICASKHEMDRRRGQPVASVARDTKRQKREERYEVTEIPGGRRDRLRHPGRG